MGRLVRGANAKTPAHAATGGRDGMRWAAVATYAVVAFGATVALLVLGARTDNELLGALGQTTPALAALVTIMAFPGRGEGLRRLGLHRLGGPRWYALALLIPVLPIGLSYLGGAALGLLDYRWPLGDAGMLGLTLFRLTAGYLIVTAVPLVWALGEEIGWRGWLQSNLIPALGARRAVLLVGSIWAVWHYPFVFWGGYYESGSPWLDAALLTYAVVPIGIVFGWVRLRSRSLWPVVLIHAATNSARLVWDSTFVPASPNWVYVAGEAGVVSIAVWLGLAWWAWRRLPTEGPAATAGGPRPADRAQRPHQGTRDTARFQWLFYELRRLGLLGLAMPALVALLFCSLALLMALTGAEAFQISRLLVAGLEMGLPLAAGVVAAGIVAEEPAIDLQLAVRTRYRTTLARRLALLAIWTSLFAFVWASALYLAGFWSLWVPGPFLTGQLAWLSPLLWFVAAGAALSLLIGGRSIGGALLGGLWTFEILSRETFLTKDWLRPEFLFATTFSPGADYWLSNRLSLICTALVLGMVAWALSSNTELMAKGGET